MDLELNRLQSAVSVAAVETDAVADNFAEPATALPKSIAPAVLPAAVVATTTPNLSNLSGTNAPPGFRRGNSLTVNATPVMFGSAVLTVSAIALIFESIIVVSSGGNRYSPAGSVMGLGCIVIGGRGLFGNFQESGLKSVNLMIIMTVFSLALSIWATYDIKQSFNLAAKRINTVHMCLNLSDTYSSCDALNTVYSYLKYSYYTGLWCIGWSVYILIVIIKMKKDLMNFLNRRTAFLQQQNNMVSGNDAERQSLLADAVDDQDDNNANNNNNNDDDGDDVESNHRQSPGDHPEHVTIVDDVQPAIMQVMRKD